VSQSHLSHWQVSVKNSNSGEAKKVCLAMVQSLKVEEKKYRLGSSLILLKREVVDDMEKRRGLLLVRHTIVIQNLIRQYMAKAIFEKKLSLRRNLQSVLNLQTILRRSIAQRKYADMLGVVIQVKKRMSVQVGESNKPPEVISESTSNLAEIPEAKEVFFRFFRRALAFVRQSSLDKNLE
jgi:myosin heavy subunit